MELISFYSFHFISFPNATVSILLFEMADCINKILITLRGLQVHIWIWQHLETIRLQQCTCMLGMWSENKSKCVLMFVGCDHLGVPVTIYITISLRDVVVNDNHLRKKTDVLLSIATKITSENDSFLLQEQYKVQWWTHHTFYATCAIYLLSIENKCPHIFAI